MFEGLFQPMHMIIILAIVLIFFGPGKLPELGSSLGKAIREFKKTVSAVDKPLIENQTADVVKTAQAKTETTSSHPL